MRTAAAQTRVFARPFLPPPTSERQDRIVQHCGLVRAIATRMARRYPAHVDLDELVNAGTLGLIDAADRFDAARGVSFRTYAEIRIRGAIVDALRSADWVPRAVRQEDARVEGMWKALRARLGRDPDAREMAAALGMSLETYVRHAAHAEPRNLLSLDAPASEEAETLCIDTVAADDGADPLDRCIAADLGRAAARAMDALPERERAVMKLYYEDDLSLKEIGAVLGVSESRVCQLHGGAVKRLQRILAVEAA